MFEKRPDYQRGLDRFAAWAGRPVPLSDFVIGTRAVLTELVGVEDLSTIEGARLRWCVEAALEWLDDEFKLGEKGAMVNIEREAALTWLATTYGVDLNALNAELGHTGRVTEEFQAWLNCVRARAHQW